MLRTSPLEERPSKGNPLFCTVVLKMHNLYGYEITIVKIGESMSEKDENYQRELEILKRLRPIDDSLMRCMFRDNIPFSEFFLRTVTRISDLEIVEMETQREGVSRFLCKKVLSYLVGSVCQAARDQSFRVSMSE